MIVPTLKHLSNSELFDGLEKLRGRENHTVADVVNHLSEVDERGSYREAGYSTLFSYCREKLNYSEPSAGRRVRAARALRQSPEIYSLLLEGKLSLCAISEVAPIITEDNEREVLALVTGRSKQEAERVAARFGAPQKSKRERVVARRVSFPVEGASLNFQGAVTTPVERFGVHLEVSAECREMIEEAKNLTGARKVSDLLEILLRKYLKKEKKVPARKSVQKKVVQEKEKADSARVMTRSRYITQRTRREVRERDGHQCSYVSPDGKRCSEKHALQIDHKHPYAVGGSNRADNLRMLCPSHNRFCAEEFYGKELIEERRRCRKGRNA